MLYCAKTYKGFKYVSMNMEKKELTYKDENTGHILFGQSVLERHTEEIKIYHLWIKMFVLLGYLFLFYLMFLFYYIVRNNVVNNIVAMCL
tara:strand:- start:363 stop:632 length:270 start_codon:yes stop_codon:yes gene_type:complete